MLLDLPDTRRLENLATRRNRIVDPHRPEDELGITDLHPVRTVRTGIAACGKGGRNVFDVCRSSGHGDLLWVCGFSPLPMSHSTWHQCR